MFPKKKKRIAQIVFDQREERFASSHFKMLKTDLGNISRGTELEKV